MTLLFGVWKSAPKHLSRGAKSSGGDDLLFPLFSCRHFGDSLSGLRTAPFDQCAQLSEPAQHACPFFVAGTAQCFREWADCEFGHAICQEVANRSGGGDY